MFIWAASRAGCTYDSRAIVSKQSKGKRSATKKKEEFAQAVSVACKWERRLRRAWQQESRVRNLNHRVTTTISTTVTIDEAIDSDLHIDHSWEEIDTRPAHGCKGVGVRSWKIYGHAAQWHVREHILREYSIITVSAGIIMSCARDSDDTSIVFPFVRLSEKSRTENVGKFDKCVGTRSENFPDIISLHALVFFFMLYNFYCHLSSSFTLLL